MIPVFALNMEQKYLLIISAFNILMENSGVSTSEF